MNEQHKYRATDKMSDLICDNYSLLMVMSRFGLSLGFGDKSVKDVCEAQHVDYRTFLAVANFISEEQYSYSADNDSFSIPALMDYLKRAHAYFLDFNLPAMRRKLIEAIDCSRDNDVAYLILKFFDEYAKEVRRHMEYENKAVFTYVEQLLQGRPSDVYNIATFASKHNQIDTKLKELKNIIIKYYPTGSNAQLLNDVLIDLFMTEEDLFSHCHLEDTLFLEAVVRLEDERQEQAREENPQTEEQDGEDSANDALSDREKEVIVCVVKGMSNKEIAEQLYISVNTVMTHRRNISRKLQIHSPAGLTIYAIVNGLINLEDVKL